MVPSHIRRSTVCFLTAALLGLALVQPGRGADFDKLDVPSLKEIPADAAYYSAMLRTREQVELIGKSKAWAKLTGLPFVQDGWKQMLAKFNQEGAGEKYKEFVKDPANQQLVDMLLDMVSHEIFVYGGANSADFAQLMTELVSAMQYGPALIQIAGNPKNLDQSQMAAASVFQVLVKSQQLINAPDVVLGFKLSKEKPAEAQLERLEDILKGLAALDARFKGKVKKVKAGGVDFLTINVEGSLLPLKEYLAPLKEFEEKEGQFDAVVKKLSDTKLTLSLGVRKGYLLVSFGSSTAHLDKLGQGAKLVDTKEFQPLAKYAGEKITSINYLSKALHAKVGPSKGVLDNYMIMLQAYLPQAGLDAKQTERLKKDLAAFVKDMQANIPEPGAMLSFGFLSPRGSESYTYDWGQNPATDGTKPLTLLNHVGGSPLMAVVGRSKHDAEQYPKMVQWLKLAHGWFEEIGLPKLPDDKKDEYKKAMKALTPLLNRLHETTGKLLVPALADGQAGFVLDAKLTSKSWFKGMPPAANGLPLPEPALLFGVSDSEQLVKAFIQYRVIANEALVEMRKLNEEVPEFVIPVAKMSKIKGGTLYYYDLPQDNVVDEQLLPNAGVSDKVAVITVSKAHTERLLSGTPLKLDGGPLGDPKKKLSGASYVNYAGMLDMVMPWIEYGFEQAPVAGFFNKDDVFKQTRAVFDVLKCYRSTASATYQEGGATITHAETVIRDLGN